MKGIRPLQANRLREDIKRSAHIHAIIKERIKELKPGDAILETAILLACEEYDAIARDLDGMLLGNNGNKKGGKR